MENASKALIIAGAILISILLISVGIIVMNSINDPISKSGDQAKSQTLEIFNSKLVGYAGDDVKSASIKTLVSAISSSNGANAEQIYLDPTSKVKNSAGTDVALKKWGQIQSLVNVKKTYTVEFTYADSDAPTNIASFLDGITGTTANPVVSKKGCICGVKITEN